MNDFDDVLQQCLDNIASDNSTPEQCLARYPQFSSQLQPYLLAAWQLKYGREVRPSPFFKDRLRADLTQKIRSSPRPIRGLPLFFSRMALNVTVLVVAVVMVSTAFAQAALPGEALYSWKLASEGVWQTVTIDPLGTELRISNRRINEYVAISKDETRRTRVLNGYHTLLVHFETEKDPAEQARILVVLKTHQESLKKAGLSIPELDSYFSGASNKSGNDVPITAPDTSVTSPKP